MHSTSHNGASGGALLEILHLGFAQLDELVHVDKHVTAWRRGARRVSDGLGGSECAQRARGMPAGKAVRRGARGRAPVLVSLGHHLFDLFLRQHNTKFSHGCLHLVLIDLRVTICVNLNEDLLRRTCDGVFAAQVGLAELFHQRFTRFAPRFLCGTRRAGGTQAFPAACTECVSQYLANVGDARRGGKRAAAYPDAGSES